MRNQGYGLLSRCNCGNVEMAVLARRQINSGVVGLFLAERNRMTLALLEKTIDRSVHIPAKCHGMLVLELYSTCSRVQSDSMGETPKDNAACEAAKLMLRQPSFVFGCRLETSSWVDGCTSFERASTTYISPSQLHHHTQAPKYSNGYYIPYSPHTPSPIFSIPTQPPHHAITHH